MHQPIRPRRPARVPRINGARQRLGKGPAWTSGCEVEVGELPDLPESIAPRRAAASVSAGVGATPQPTAVSPSARIARRQAAAIRG